MTNFLIKLQTNKLFRLYMMIRPKYIPRWARFVIPDNLPAQIISNFLYDIIMGNYLSLCLRERLITIFELVEGAWLGIVKLEIILWILFFYFYS